MEGVYTYDAYDPNNKVNDEIVEDLVDDANMNDVSQQESLKVASQIEESNKFQVIDYSEALDKANNAKKTTIPIMSKFERAKIIGYRATQISKGSPALIDVKNISDPYEIAEKELSEKKTPIIIRRTLPDNTYEDWKVEEFLF